jgi:hypothetical protein
LGFRTAPANGRLLTFIFRILSLPKQAPNGAGRGKATSIFTAIKDVSAIAHR